MTTQNITFISKRDHESNADRDDYDNHIGGVIVMIANVERNRLRECDNLAYYVIHGDSHDAMSLDSNTISEYNVVISEFDC